MLKKEIYKGFNIFSYDSKNIEIGKKILDNNYKTEIVFKDSKRSTVSEIKIDNNSYILKRIGNETIIPQRKLMTLFKKGEALTTLININKIMDELKISEYVRPLLAINRRKHGMIDFSLLVLEKVEGNSSVDKVALIELIKKIHRNKIYHGDFNPSNFIFIKNGIKIIDTQGKKMSFGNYRAHYDILTMKMDTYPDLKYPYKKNLFYYIALAVKKMKRLKFVEKIKEKKKILREKGWKI
jgi:lipopolysaccharide core biosynthesis protein rfaY